MKDGDLYDQASAMPTRKMLAAAIGGILTALLTSWAAMAAGLSPWLAWLDQDLVKTGLPVLAAVVAGYLTRERARGTVRPIDRRKADEADLLRAGALATVIALALALMVGGCSMLADVVPGADVWVAGAVKKGQDAADDALESYRFGSCQAATIGSVRRRYGRTAEDAERYRSFCSAEGQASVIRPAD